jgi:NADH dehydrogenase
MRPSVIWGPQDEFANVQARLIRLTPVIFPIAGDGQARFQPVWVGDVVEAFVKALDDPTTIGQDYELGGPEVLTYEEIVDRVLKALHTSRKRVKVPVSTLRPVVAAMQAVLPNPPVTTSLLDLLAVPNVVGDNALVNKFGITPRAFTPENLSYMRDFSLRVTLGKFFGRATEEDKVRRAATR